jgi:1-deoxy-D-xylulose-5-phosphate reductoisomerase
MSNIILLGATGSIGDSTISICQERRDKFYIEAMVAGSDAIKLAARAIAAGSKRVAIADESKYQELKELLSGHDIEVFAGASGIREITAYEYDIAMSAIVGIAGLMPTANLMQHGTKRIALANKESLVCAGDLINQLADEMGTEIIPVDSEHSALFQAFEKHNEKHLDKMTLTASGGAFRDLSLEEMADVTLEQATSHPNWNMGPKVTVDCSTLINKGLEFIETCKLFRLPPEKIDVLIHHQSIVHSMVSYKDGSTLAHLGSSDMRTPIAYALSHPERLDFSFTPLDLAAIGSLTFAQPDYKRFPLLKLAIDVASQNQLTQLVMNCANEVAVQSFLKGQIGFLDISRLVHHMVESYEITQGLTSFTDATDHANQVFKQTKEAAKRLQLQVSA